jgi:alginate O-acetyltransferase complex protein AlgI
MLFNSIDFAVFLPIVLFIYWFVVNNNYKHQNVLISISSYIFYGWWDWRFLSIILFSTIVDYSLGLALSSQKRTTSRKLLLATSIIVNLGLLCVFKYFNFFIANFVSAFSVFGIDITSNSLNIILPVGISFYTFQTLSYTIDIYYKKQEATKDFIAYSSFVSFFPQLVAGPIERAKNLLPQFQANRTFNYDKAADGCRQILWGLFKKIVIADNCAIYVNDIFTNYNDYSGSTLLLGAFFFAFQIYGDFSGYSDIAIGTARLLGFNLMQNFAFPYFSRDIAEFWRRWHISLSTWFRDYLYIPLGGSRCGNWMKIRNIFIIFIVSGFWHGANWTFIMWGVINAVYLLPIILLNRNRINTGSVAIGRFFPSIRETFQMITTFFLTLIAWVFFRASSISDAISYLQHLFSPSLFSLSLRDIDKISYGYDVVYLLVILTLFIILEWAQRTRNHALEFSEVNCPLLFRWITYYAIIWLIIQFGATNKTFIYFQF